MNQPQRTSMTEGIASLISSMVMRSTLSMLVLAALATISFLLLQCMVDLSYDDAHIVNLSGRQRMIVASAAGEAERLTSCDEPCSSEDIELLRRLISEIESTNLAFLNGNPALNIPDPSPAIRSILLNPPSDLFNRTKDYVNALRDVAENCNNLQYDTSASMRQIRKFTNVSDDPSTLASNSPHVCLACSEKEITNNGLATLDGLVHAVQRESELRLADLKVTAGLLLATSLVTIAITASTVFLPMIRRIRFAASQLVDSKIATETRSRELESVVGELELLREEDGRRDLAMLNILSDLRQERSQLKKEALVRERAERQFRSVVEAAPSAMIMINWFGSIVLVNKAAQEVFRYDRDEMIGQQIETLIPDRFRPNHPQKRTGFFRDPRTTLIGQGRELFGKRKDGTEFVVEIGLNPIETDEGLFVLSSIVDMSAHKQAQESTARLASIVETSHDAIYAKTIDGTITSWNCAAERMFGYSKSQAVGQNFHFLIPPDRADEVPYILDQVMNGRLVHNMETIRQRQDGTLIDVAITISPMTDGTGDIVGASVIARDITQRKRAELKLERYASDLEKSNTELAQFAYIASHDLKEPLRMVSSYTRLLAEEYMDKLDADANRYIDYATNGASRMTALIDDLLDYSRVGRVDSPFKKTRLGSVVQGAIHDLHTLVKETNSTIEVKDELPTVNGNSTQLGQLFQNTIGNAIKFRHPDRDPLVVIGCRQNDDSWEISIQDNGIGIDPEYHDRIFQIFQRLHTAEEYPGTGIGLAVCKKIVEQHGGRISVDSTLGGGTTLRFTIPLDSPKKRQVEGSSPGRELMLCNN